MKQKELDALKGSIEKWRKIACEDGEDKGTSNCPLCVLYRVQRGGCIECPVYMETKLLACRKTPYEDFCVITSLTRMAYDLPYDSPKIAWTDELAEIATAEMNFLISLLPAYEQENYK